MADTKDLTLYKENIENAFVETFSNFSINVFTDLEEGFEIPAIVINKPILEPIDTTAMNNVHLKTKMNSNAFIIYSAADKDNELDCLQAAAEVAKFIHLNRFGEKMPARVETIEPVLEEGLEDYFIQRIDFSQNIEL